MLVTNNVRLDCESVHLRACVAHSSNAAACNGACMQHQLIFRPPRQTRGREQNWNCTFFQLAASDPLCCCVCRNNCSVRMDYLQLIQEVFTATVQTINRACNKIGMSGGITVSFQVWPRSEASSPRSTPAKLKNSAGRLV